MLLAAKADEALDKMISCVFSPFAVLLAGNSSSSSKGFHAELALWQREQYKNTPTFILGICLAAVPQYGVQDAAVAKESG